MGTNIVIDEDWEYSDWTDEEYLVTNNIWCDECGHEFDVTEYTNDMIEDMKYCPFCGKKIREVVYK